MGAFQTAFEIADLRGERWEALQGTVGLKPVNTWVPQSLLEKLGVQIEKRVSLRHTDGRLIKRDVGQAQVRIGDKAATTTVVFGAERDPILIGSETLAELGLQADLVKEQLA